MLHCKVKKVNHQMVRISMGSFLKIPMYIYASIPMYYTLYMYIHVQGGC